MLRIRPLIHSGHNIHEISYSTIFCPLNMI